MDSRWVIYCDPPYLFEVRASDRPRYEREFGTRDEHRALLKLLIVLRARVMVSGYRSELYDAWLDDWRRIDYTAMTPGGPRTESLWCNFERPARLHDDSVLGENYRKRQDFRRMKRRWLDRLSRMDARRREALLGAIAEWRRQRAD